MNTDIRSAWLDYYQSLGFNKISGAPLVHPLFPMSFNMSAGLVQLDPQIRSPKKVIPQKQCLVQKCFRHFDVDKVGDNNHLSFFEMTGAFEIGTFSETQTVKYLWDFLTIKLKIDPKRLWITSFNQQEITGKKVVQPKK